VRGALSILGGLLVILAALLGAMWLQGPRQGPEHSELSESGARSVTQAPSSPDPSGSATTAVPPEREPVSHADGIALEGLVRSSLGPGLTEALVTLTLPSADDEECEPVWRDSDWGVLERQTFETRTDATGAFSFADLPRDWSHALLLWASHPTHGTGSLVLSNDRRAWPAPLELVLEPRRALSIVVLDSRGTPVPGASVTQDGLAAALPDNTTTGIGAERAPRFFHRQYTTTADGAVTAVYFAGKQVLTAERGDERSAPWIGSEAEQVILTLRPTFELGGTLSWPDVPQAAGQERRLVVSAQARNLWRDLHTIRGVAPGPWGPITVPLIEADRYRVRLEGAPLVPAEAFFPPPDPRSRVRKDLTTETGVELWFKVVDERGTVIPTAHVVTRWQDPANPDHWHFAAASKTKEDQIGVLSVPRGSFESDFFAPGYVPATFGPADTSICDTAHVRMELQRAGRLRGRVLHRGAPVEDFEVLVWRSNDTSSRRSQTLLGRSDGSFELDTVPLGEFWVAASSSFTPACEPVAVTCKEGETAEVTLELLDGLRGRGRLLAHGTGEPLAQGAVQLFVRGAAGPIARWGLPIPVAPDGSFDLAGFMPGENRVRALARGFSNQVVTREAAPGATVEWGDIVLAPTQELRLTIEPAERARGARAMGTGAAALPWRDFSEAGVLVYAEASAGDYAFAIVEPDGTATTFEEQLIPDEEWHLRTRLGGPNRLSVRAVSGGRDAMSKIDYVRASYVTADGRQLTRTRVVEHGAPVVFEGIEAPEVTVQLFLDQEPIATGGGVFRGGQLGLVLPLDERSLLVRVVDPDGQPVPDTRVTIDVPSHPGLFLAGGTDSRGECRIKGVPESEIRVSLMHGNRGVRLGIPVDASADSVELELQGGCRLELLFEDRGTPLGGVSCSLIDEQGWSLVSAYQADELGRLTIANLDPGAYRLRATRPDCWTADVSARAATQSTPQTVQLRRLGDLGLEVRTSAGVPTAGVAVQLTSLEFEADVAEWIEAERVPETDLVTDASGQIQIGRLPSGPYRWQIRLSQGEFVEGTLEVLPGDVTTSLLSIP